MAELPSQDYLKSRIDYNPDTGEARWKPVDESYGRTWRGFNRNHAGRLLNSKDITFKGQRFRTLRVIYKLHHGIDPVDIIKPIDKNNKNIKIDNLRVGGIKPPTAFKKLTDNMCIPEECNTLLRYDKYTGNLYWLPREDKSFNTRRAGTEAGHYKPKDYCNVKLFGKSYKAHRIAWYLYYGVDPGTYLIDHKNGNKHDNSIRNLRLANHSLNLTAAASTLSGGYTMVGNMYRAQISLNNVRTHIGLFYTQEEAVAAYHSAVERYKPIYQFTPEEQAELDELYATYPNVSRELQHRCHALQVKALNHYIEGAAQ